MDAIDSECDWVKIIPMRFLIRCAVRVADVTISDTSGTVKNESLCRNPNKNYQCELLLHLSTTICTIPHRLPNLVWSRYDFDLEENTKSQHESIADNTMIIVNPPMTSASSQFSYSPILLSHPQWQQSSVYIIILIYIYNIYVILFTKVSNTDSLLSSLKTNAFRSYCRS